MSDFDDAALDFKRMANSLKNSAPRISIQLALDQLISLKNRVFSRGQDKNESSIGKYSTKPMLVGETSFTRYGSQVAGRRAVKSVFGSKKKRRSRDWVTVNGNKLIVLKGGYKEFRGLVGRLTGKVDLKLTGDLFRSIVSGKHEKGAAVGSNSDDQFNKARWNEEHFEKTIFEPSGQDEIDSENFIKTEIDKILNESPS